MPSPVVTAPGNVTEEEQAICEVFFMLPYSTYEFNTENVWKFIETMVGFRKTICHNVVDIVQVLGTGPFF